MTVKTLRTALIALVFVLLGAGDAAAGGWELAEDEGGVQIFTRAQSGSDVDAIRAKVSLPFGTDAVAAIMTDLDRHKTFMPALKTLEVLRKTTLSNGRRVQVIYQVNHVPALDDRDVVLYTETWSKKTPAGTVWRSSFRAVTTEGPPPTDAMVRITRLAGSWEIRPTKGGGSVFTYVCHTEVGGNIPDFLAESGQVDTILEMLIKFVEVCRKSLK